MVETHDHFIRRLAFLGRKHKKMTHGYTTRVGPDGLIVVTPKRRARNSAGANFLLLALGMFFGLKILMLLSVGPQGYEERLVKLQDGTFVEQAGAFVLGIDPVTEAIAGYVGPMLP